MQPETNYIRMFKSAPAPVKVAVILTAILAVNNIVASAYGPVFMCIWGLLWMLKGFGAIRWIVMISLALGAFCSFSSRDGVLMTAVGNTAACLVLLVLLYLKPSREWFKRKGEEYYEWKKSLAGTAQK